MRKTYKYITSLCAVLIFALTISVSAYADPFSISVGIAGASGGGLFGSMAASSGISIGFPSNTDPLQSDVLWNDLNPGVTLTGTKGQKTITDPVTQIPTVYDYISVDIGDWLQAQNDYIDEFVSNYQVEDNDSGQITVPESYSGVSIGTVLLSTTGLGEFSLPAGISISIIENPQNPNGKNVYIYQNNVLLTSKVGQVLTALQEFSFYKTSTGSYLRWRHGSQYTNVPIDNSYYNTTTSSDWQSGTVDTGVFDTWHNPTIMIPANSWSPSDPTQWNPAEFLEALTVKMVSGLSSDITVEDDYDPGPVPPPPLPTTPLGEMPYDDWYDDMGDLIGQGVSDGLGDIEGDIEDIKEETETQTGILDRILEKLGDIVDTLEDILSGVLELVQEIVLATETFIAGLLNSIIGGFGGWLSTMKQSFNIWHYVVEWVNSISSVLSWFWTMAGSTSYYIQLPIYASLAGAVVLAFYKRFGR